MSQSYFKEQLQTVLKKNALFLQVFTRSDEIAITNPSYADYEKGLQIGKRLDCDTYSPGSWGITVIEDVQFHWNPVLSILFMPSKGRIFSLAQTEAALAADSFVEKISTFID